MRCVMCGSDDVAGRRERLHYTISGLPNVWINNALVEECRSCGETYETIERTDELHAVLARSLATKVPKLTGAEVRFLRKWIGWSREEFAKRLDVSPATVSRWETDAQPISATTERLIRLLAMTNLHTHDYTVDVVKDVAKKPARSQRVEVQDRKHAWALVHA